MGEIRHYGAVLYPGEEGFGVAFPDFPGCISYGHTIQDATRMAEEALNAHVALMVRFGDAIPEPTPMERLDEVILDPDEEEAGRIVVRVEIPNG